MPFCPRYSFGSPVGQWVKFYAWVPTRLWDGRWIWLNSGYKIKIIKHEYLSGPDWSFWSKTDY